MATFSKHDIVDALTHLGRLSADRGQKLGLTMVGGGVMVLVYETRLSTRDLDIVVLPPSQPQDVRDLAHAVASERNWPDDWINDAAKGFMVGLSAGPVIFAAPGIEVRRPAVEQLLAMKLCAWRDDLDIADARRLLQELGGDYDAVWASVQPYLQPGRELRAQYAFDDLWESTHGQS